MMVRDENAVGVRARHRDFGALFAPRSVAVVGASDTPGKWGHVLAKGALAGEHRRAVYLVNPSGGKILGRRAHRSLAELPESPELVAVAVPAGAFAGTVDAAIAAGARAIVAISAGLGESGPEGTRLEQQAVARIREAGALLLGPNCLGVADAHAELSLAWAGFRAGPVALISQSGNLALEIAELLAVYDLGISRFASLGNQADVDATDLLRAVAAGEQTRLIALYVEDFRDGRAFARAASQVVAAGKPVVLMSVGRSAAGARSAMSHTGALASDERAIDAACRAAGVVRVSTPKELVDAAQALLASRRLRGRRIGVIGDGGGHNAVAADTVSALGFELPGFSERLSGELAAVLPATASTANPVDFAGGGERDITTYPQVARTLLESGQVDAVLLTGYFGGYGGDGELHAARELARIGREGPAALVVHTMHADSAAASILRASGTPVYREIEAAARGLVTMRARAAGAAHVVPEVPVPVPRPVAQDYWSARRLLASAGIELVKARRVCTADDAAGAARELGFPVVLKALGALHKSDAGGVVVDIRDAATLRRTLDALQTRLAATEFSLERMAPVHDGVELLVGTRRDPRFGPIVLVGLGGLYAEILDDVAVALAPIDADGALALVLSLRGAALVTGARGRPSLALTAAAAAIAAVSALGASCPDIDQLEINPLLITPIDAVALDARVIPRASSATTSPAAGDWVDSSDIARRIVDKRA
jgi:acyl-CoA synthetase (NDP forming)